MKKLKLGLRRIAQNKVYSIVNISGFAIALSVCLAIVLFTNHHFSFDKYVENIDNSYRIVSRLGDGTYRANTFGAFKPFLQDISEIEKSTVCYTMHNINQVFVDDNEVAIKELVFADDSFLDFFGVELVSGSRKSINEVNTALLTPQMAHKLFNGQNAIGRSIKVRSFTRNAQDLINFTVSGIVEPLPNTSHIGYDMILSAKGHFDHSMSMIESRKVFAAATYIQLNPLANVASVEERLVNLTESKLGKAPGPPLQAFNHKLQPLSEIHFTNNIGQELRPTIQRSSLNILLFVGLLIFIMATVNFINMYVAQSAFRHKEYSIVKMLGGRRKDVFIIRFIEVCLSVFASFVIVLILMFVLSLSTNIPLVKALHISMNNVGFWKNALLLLFGALFLILVLGSLNINRVIGRQSVRGLLQNQKTLVPLVITQFVLVTGLLCFTLGLNKQMHYVASKSLGFTSENVAIIKVPERNDKINTLRDELRNIPGVISTSAVQHYPGYHLQDVVFENKGLSFPFVFGMIDTYATKTLNIEAVEYFTPMGDKAFDGWLINETFYNALKQNFTVDQLANSNFPINEQSANNERENFKILGVIKDFHYESLHTSVENFAFSVQNPMNNRSRFVLVRLNQSQVNEVLSKAERLANRIYPNKPFNYSFMDEELNAKYESEATLLKLVNIFSILSMLVASLGLIGLSLFITQKRVKEIGIRKVNGATVFELLAMLNKDFVMWLSLAFILAFPLAYVAVGKWLESFAYKTEISWWVFALSGFIVLVLAVIAVSWQTFKAARQNPVEALRYE